MAWWQLMIELPAADADDVAWWLADRLDTPAEVQDAGTMGGGDLEPGRARVLAGFDEPPGDDMQAALRTRLVAIGLGDTPVRTREIDDDSWKDGWRAFFHARRLSARVSVRPPWEPPVDDTHVAVVIDPGLAFGTGTHETTTAVMQLLDEALAASPGVPVLDLGCGSAILSIAAARLGSHATGVEIDGTAVENARHNVALNGAEGAVDLIHGGLGSVRGRHPLVVANILASILIEHAGVISDLADRDLILSGFLIREADRIATAYADFEVHESIRAGEWAAWHMRRRR